MARKSTKRPGTASASAKREELSPQWKVGPDGMDAGIPSAGPFSLPKQVEDELQEQYERMQAERAKAEQEEKALYERYIGAQESLAASIVSLVAELERHRLAKGPVGHAEPPLTRSEPAPNVGKSDGKAGGIASPTMEDAQRAVLKFLASHEPAEVGKRLAAIGVEKVSTIKGTDAEKATKYAAVIKVLE